MIAKIKQYSAYIYTALATILAGVLYYLNSKNSSLKSENAKLRGELDVKEDKVKLEEQKKIDTKTEGDYQSIRNRYLSQSGDGGGSGEGEL